jgi:hypothetical protein
VTLLAAATTILLVIINSKSNHTAVLCGVGSSQLAILVPLSGYETRQEFTYTSNLTSTTVPYYYYNLIPAAFRTRTVDFLPHTFNIGDIFESNSTLGVFNYIMQTAYTREDAAGSSAPRAVNIVPSFSYMNNDLSTCDVVSTMLSTAFNGTLASNSIADVR